MRKLVSLVFFVAALVGGGAEAKVTARVALDQQVMQVYVDNTLAYSWPVSSGRSGFGTPGGSYKPYLLDMNHRSAKYDNTPMPYSVFFRGGYAIHGTTVTGALGRPASHGCIRLSNANARTFYSLVQSHGMAATQISITGRPPAGGVAVARRDQAPRAPQNQWPGTQSDSPFWFLQFN